MICMKTILTFITIRIGVLGLYRCNLCKIAFS